MNLFKEMKKLDYQKHSIDFLVACKNEGFNTRIEHTLPTESFDKAYDLAIEILSTRFANELKQYNGNAEKAYDEFVFRKNLDYFRIFIEEFLFLDKTDDEIPFYVIVQRHLREILNHLYAEIQN